MLDFSTRDLGGGRSGEAWLDLVRDPDLSAAIITSLLLALLTVVGMLLLLVPTMIWVRLRVPRAPGWWSSCACSRSPSRPS